MPINKDVITKEMFLKALQCKTADELIVLAKADGIELTKRGRRSLHGGTG